MNKIITILVFLLLGVTLSCEKIPETITQSLPKNLENLKHSVVTIHSQKGIGTGFIVSSSGCLLTAAHVVPYAADPFFVDNPGIISWKKYEVLFRGKNDTDLAILCPKEIFVVKNFVTFAHKKIEKNSRVFVYGTYINGDGFFLRDGIVLDYLSVVTISPFEYRELFRSYFPGNLMGGFSGSPVVSDDGSVVGVFVICQTLRRDEKASQEMHLCSSINANNIVQFLHQYGVRHNDAA